MGALRFPGFSERLKQAMIAAGYVTERGTPDVPAFLRVCPYDPRMFYPWLAGRVPELETLTRLAETLRVSRAWLLLGDGDGPTPAPRRNTKRRSRMASAIAGGSANDDAPPVANAAHILPLIRRALRRVVNGWCLAPVWSHQPAYA